MENTKSGQKLSHEQIGETANKIIPLLEGLSKTDVEAVFEWIENSTKQYYFLSSPKDLRNS